MKIENNFLILEDEKLRHPKIFTGKFPTLINKNSFQKRGDCVLQMFGILEPEPFDEYYRIRGEIGEKIVKQYLDIRDENYKYLGLEAKTFDIFTHNNYFGGVLDFVLPRKSINLEVKSTSTNNYQAIVENGGREEHKAQARLGAYLGNLERVVLAYVFFTPEQEECIKKGYGDDVIQHFDYTNPKALAFINIEPNYAELRLEMKHAFNYYKGCYVNKKVPLDDISGRALEKLGLITEDDIFAREVIC
jgi:hypothetical protein